MPCTIDHAALLQRKPPVVLCPECILPLRARSPGIVDLTELPSSPVHPQNQASSAPLLDDKPIAFSPRSKHTPPGLITPISNSTHHVLREFTQSLAVARSKIAESIAATAKKPQDAVNYITIHVYAAEEYPEKISELDYVRLEVLQKIATMHQNAASLATKFSGQGEVMDFIKTHWNFRWHLAVATNCRLVGHINTEKGNENRLLRTCMREHKVEGKTNVQVEIKPEIKPEVKPDVNGIDKAGEEAGLQHEDETADSSTRKSRYNNLGPPLQTRGAAKRLVSGHKRTYLEANQGEGVTAYAATTPQTASHRRTNVQPLQYSSGLVPVFFLLAVTEGEDVASSGSDCDPLEDAEQLDLTGFAE
ncbi:hypothetical protein GGR50DRAFT_698790 [Xylaria sp. CBS 124048]|nr:hypothetical protein GGR50DRAFT_698790 [Xylaria sp. CBS 124048]